MTMGRWRGLHRARYAVAGVAAAAAIATTSGARAEGDTAAAEALFQQAKSLAEAAKWAEACPKFQASYKLDKQLGTLMNLADCEEHVGRIATAWAHWGEAVEIAEKTGDKRSSFAAGRRAPLVKRLPMVKIDVVVAPGSSSALAVYRDEVKIDPAAYGVPLPSDPGSHVISVRRGAEVLSKQSVTAAEGQTTPVALDLAAIERAAPPPVAPVAVVAPLSNQKVIGYAVIGVGGATLLAAGVLEILAITNKSSANAPDSCFNGFCTTAGIGSVSTARTFANAGQWVGIGGIVVAVVGITLVATAPRIVPAAPKPDTAARAAAPTLSGWLGPAGGGLGLRGAF
jgi:hypothetical protein